MKELTAWIVVFIMLSVSLRYAYQVYKKEISPALSSWLIFFTGASLSFATYMVAENRDFQSGVLNAVDVIVILIITSSIIVWGNTSGVLFKSFEKKYLVGAGGIVFFWIVSNDAFISNLLLQILIFIGYFPTIQNLMTEKRNTESFSAWGCVLLAAIVALYPAIIGGNILAFVYVGRTIVMVSIVLILMIFYNLKTRTI